MIEVADLTVRFGGVVPIDGMTITFPGGTCGLIGPNGAGKTTFFNVLSGFVRPFAGSVQAFGEDLLAMPDFKRSRWGVRRTFQTEQAIANLTVAENVLLVHEHSGGERASRRDDVDRAVAFVGLEAVADRLVGGLGAAQRRLVEIARAVVGSPRLVLLDEPCAGVNPSLVDQLRELLVTLNKEQGGSFVVIEHNMDFIMGLCPHVICLVEGRVLAEGPPAAVQSNRQVLEAYLGN